MARFNIEVAIKFSGEGSKEAADAFKSLSRSADTAMGQITQAAKGVQSAFGMLKAAGAALGLEKVAAVAFDIAHAFVGMAIEAGKAQAENALLERSIANLGAQTKVTADEVRAFAEQMSHATGFDDDSFVRAQRDLLRFGATSKEVLQQATRLGADVARTLGVDLVTAADMVGKALQHPGEGVKALKAAGLDLNEALAKTAQQMAESGNVAGAQKVVMMDLSAAVSGAAEVWRTKLPGAIEAAQTELDNFRNAAGGPLATTLNDLLNSFLQLTGGAREFGQLIGGALAIEVRGAAASFAALLDMIKVYLKYLSILSGVALAGLGLNQISKDLAGMSTEAGKTSEALKKFASGATASTAATESLDRHTQALAEGQRMLRDALAAGAAKMLAQAEAAKKAAEALERYRASLKADTPDKLFVPDIDIKKLVEPLETWAAAGEHNAGRIRDAAQQAATQIGVDWGAMLDDLQSQSDAWDQRWADDLQQAGDAARAGIVSILGSALEQLVTTGKIDFEGLWKEALRMAIQLGQQLVLEWLATEKAKTAITLQQAAIRAAANKSSSGGGGSSGSGAFEGASAAGSAYKGMSGAGMSAGTIAGFAAVAAIIAYGIWDQKNSVKHSYDTTVSVTAGYGDVRGGASGRLEGSGKEAADAIKNLLNALQDSTGAFINSMEGIVIKIRNDKKFFEARIGNEVLGRFRSMNEAIIASFKAAFNTADFKGQVDPIIKDVIQNYQGSDPAELAGYIKTVQGIIDSVSGLTDIEIKLRGLPEQAAQLTSQLQQMGVSFDDAARLAGQWTVQQMNDLRDQITGHEKSRAEQLADKQRQAALFNAQLALMRADLEAKKAALLAHTHILEGDTKITEEGLKIDKDTLIARGELVKSQASIFSAQLQVQGQYISASSNLLAASSDYVAQQIAAIDQILANLPKAIDFKEIHLGGGGGGGREPKQPKGGGYSGPSKADRRQDLAQELQDIARSMLPDFVQQIRNLNDWLAKTTAEAIALGVPLDQINQLYEQQRQALIEQAQREVSQYTKSGPQNQLDEILKWADDLRKSFEELGLTMEQIDEATQKRIDDLKQEALVTLNVPGAAFAQQIQQIADALQFLRDNMDLLGISEAQLAEITAAASAQLLMGALESLSQLTDNEDVKRKLEQLSYTLRIAELKAEIQVLYAMGFLAQDSYDWIMGIINDLPAEPPAPGDTGGGHGGFTGGAGQQGRFGDKDQKLRDKLQKLIDAINRIRDTIEDLKTGPLAALTLQQQYDAAQAQYQSILARAQAGDLEALQQLPEAATHYLELAQQMFGSSSLGYQSILAGVISAMQAISDLYPPGDTLEEWLHSDLDTVKLYLQQIRDALTGGHGGGPLGGPAGHGGGYSGPALDSRSIAGTGYSARAQATGGAAPALSLDIVSTGLAQVAGALREGLHQVAASQESSADRRAYTGSRRVA